jgi:hypothetical protein
MFIAGISTEEQGNNLLNSTMSAINYQSRPAVPGFFGGHHEI